MIEIARQKGFVRYVGDGSNHWSAAHMNDVARLYRLALEKSAPARYHAVGEEGVQLRAIADVLGKGLRCPFARSRPTRRRATSGGWPRSQAKTSARRASRRARAGLAADRTGIDRRPREARVGVKRFTRRLR